MHGGDNDVLWLQKEYHVYAVNVFDTEKACQVSIAVTYAHDASATHLYTAQWLVGAMHVLVSGMLQSAEYP